MHSPFLKHSLKQCPIRFSDSGRRLLTPVYHAAPDYIVPRDIHRKSHVGTMVDSLFYTAISPRRLDISSDAAVVVRELVFVLHETAVEFDDITVLCE